ncbi:MAG: hypothetical protein MUC94_10635 [bacterium]|jgi:hypothetical protein|nr:hypothetical protein [bacterium]
MSQHLDLKPIEKKIYVSFHQDGLIDLFLGFLMLVAILSSTLDTSGVADAVRIAIYAPLMVIIGPGLYMLGKKYITFPRLGYVKLGSKQKRKRRIVIFSIITAVLLTLIILTLIVGNQANNVGPVFGIKAEFWSSAIVTLIIIGIFSIIAFVLMTPRFYLLGLIVGMSEPLYMLLKHFTHIKHIGVIAYGIPGVLLIVLGAIVLKRFVTKYPLPKAGDADYQVN